MPDPRFYEELGPVRLGELAQLTGAVIDPAHADRQVSTIAPLERAGPDAVAFLGDRKYLADLGRTQAAACFITADQAAAAPGGCAPLVVRLPASAYAAAAARLHRPRHHPQGAPAIHPDARLEEGVLVGVGAVIGPGAEIGAGARIGPNVVIGPGVAIGRDSEVAAGASVVCALIGDRVRILAGARVGEPGFGAAPAAGGVVDMPQVGRVIVQDGVTIGANSCIDRGAWDDTVIGENTKIDNMVQVAHNVRIGRNCLLAAHTGISGSTVVGDGVAFGGRAGVVDHVTIGDGARIGAGGGIMRDVPAGETWGGYPARPIAVWLRETAWLTRRAARKGGD